MCVFFFLAIQVFAGQMFTHVREHLKQTKMSGIFTDTFWSNDDQHMRIIPKYIVIICATDRASH